MSLNDLPRLRPGVAPADAARQIRELAHYADEGGGIVNQGNDNIVNALASWVSNVERSFRHLTINPALDELYTARYWHLRGLEPSALRLNELARDEATWQADRLKRIADEFDAEIVRLAGRPDAMTVVVDTNVFLHCRPMENWASWSFASSGPVRVVVPLRVIEELDDHKRDRNSDIQDRARGRVRWLRATLRPNGPTELRAGISIEALVPSGERKLQMSADTEILEAAETLETFTGRRVVIVTSDLGMELRAQTAGMALARVPDEYRLDGGA